MSQTHEQGRWQFWIDRGGTFTDVVARRPDGSLVTTKLLSENPEQYADAALAGIRQLLGVAPQAALSAKQVEAVRMGTTVATNALLERRGAPTLFLVTRGFRDQLRIGYQNRPKLFVRHIQLPTQLYCKVVEVDERVGAQGELVRPLDETGLVAALREAYAEGLRSVALTFMHAFRFPQHEQRAAQLAREVGFTQVSASHAVSPLMKLGSRGDTTVADAYLSPILRRYVDRVSVELGGGQAAQVPLFFMKSDGGLTDASSFQGKDAILSGPAGGIVGMVKTGLAAGFRKLIGFDMGGTSTDVSHFAGESLGDCERELETQVAGVRMRAPMMSIHTIAAGGGSILHFDGQKFSVGPDSAGANPGPACYRRGGPLTVSDCQVMLGRIQPAFFPALFGPHGDAALDQDVVRQRFEALARDVRDAGHAALRGPPVDAAQVAEGFLRVAVANMANAIKFISVQRGYDVTEYTLACFGGAGAQHACLVADELGIESVYIHPLAGVLSALGMGLADVSTLRNLTLERPLEASELGELERALDALETRVRAEVAQQGIASERIQTLRRVHLKYAGTDTALVVLVSTLEAMRAAFEAAYQQRFSFLMQSRSIVIESVSVEAVGALAAPALNVQEAPAQPGSRVATVSMYAAGTWRQAGVYAREMLARAQRIEGPAIVVEPNSTIVVEPGWRAEVSAQNHLLLSRYLPRTTQRAPGTTADPVMLEVFNNLFMSIAEQMGVRLANTAYSVNIKERLDFSCALFDAEGNLVANAPHMPVHLGSMGESIRTVMRKNAGRMTPGDVYMLNDPYNGGTHLPDVTVVMPVFAQHGDELLFYVAARGHHADIGGITPGSMPPASRHVDEEGVLFDNFKLVEAGQMREAALREALAAAAYPARNPDQNVADLRAQVAACGKGRDEILKMVQHFGLATVRAYMQHVQDNAEESVRRAISKLRSGQFEYIMDSGASIRVQISVDAAQRSACVDFTGSSAQLESNFNAPPAVTHAAVLYVFRTLVTEDIPMNAGCLKPLRVIIPEGSMLAPRPPAATVAGNVETSQYIVDALYGALGVMGASQGTMNNLTFGNERHQYYETIAGGSGAGDGFDGSAAVQTHMTNSRMTDPEVLEFRFPVRVEEHSIRHGSGGVGRFRGGDGALRKIRFLEAMTVGILAGHRRVPPYGMAGAGAGELGATWIERASGDTQLLGYSEQTEVSPGDAVVVSTPSGGGYGAV